MLSQSLAEPSSLLVLSAIASTVRHSGLHWQPEHGCDLVKLCTRIPYIYVQDPIQFHMQENCWSCFRRVSLSAAHALLVPGATTSTLRECGLRWQPEHGCHLVKLCARIPYIYVQYTIEFHMQDNNWSCFRRVSLSQAPCQFLVQQQVL